MDLVQTKCMERCNSQWLQCAGEVLIKIFFNNYVFAVADALRQSITKRRHKIWILCLQAQPALVNPSTGKCPQVSLNDSEFACLTGFSQSAESIAWNYFLLLLETRTVHLPYPKNNLLMTWSLVGIALCLFLKETGSQQRLRESAIFVINVRSK